MKTVTINIEDKVYDLAERLRISYYEDSTKTLDKSKHQGQWVRMAIAAMEFEEDYRAPAPQIKTEITGMTTMPPPDPFHPRKIEEIL